MSERGAWALIDRAQAGDVDAFADLYRRYRPMVFTYIRGKVLHLELAEDLTQDVFVRALRHIGTVDFQGRDPMAWLVVIARNLVFDYYKSSRYRTEARLAHELADDLDLFAAQIDPNPTPDDAAILAATRAALVAAIRQLPDKQRRVIELRYLADMSVEDTCAQTGWTEGVVKALTFRAVRRLGRAIPREAVEAAA